MPRILWTVMLFSVPLAYNPFSRWQYEPDKAALLLALTGLLVGWSLSRGIPLSFSPVEKWLAAFVFINLLATATSIMPHWSLWGDIAWRNGLLTLLVGALLFGIARRQLRELYVPIIDTLILASALLAFYGLIEKAGYAFITEDEDPVRVASTMSHPNFLASFLAMVIPMTVTRLIISRHWLFGLALILQLSAQLLTYSRAGWLATFVGLGTMSALWLWLQQKKRLTIIFISGMISGFAMLIMFSLLPPLPKEAPHTLQTATSLFRWEGATAQIRLIGWEASLEALQERPLLGYGPATYRLVIERFAPPGLAPYGGTEALGGRAHNLFLEVAINAGLVGLVIYICMVFAVLAPIARQRSLLQIALLSGLIANLTNNFFSFDSIPIWMLFWVVGGLAHSQTGTLPSKHRFRNIRLGKGVAFGSLGLAIWLITPDILAHRAESYCLGRSSCDSIELLERASKFSPTPEVLQSTLGQHYIRTAIGIKNEGYWRKGAEIYARLTNSFPNVVSFWSSRALHHRRWHLLGSQASAEEYGYQAIQFYTRALELSNRDPDLWLDRGMTYLELQEWANALADIEHSHALIADYPRYFGSMAIYAAHTGDIAAARNWQARQIAAQQEWEDFKWRR